ncbi:MAG TPA: glycosyltransferase family 39 protein, partial [bacterium]|nr:glycosyltransferase family 39 protein [bacterium]
MIVVFLWAGVVFVCFFAQLDKTFHYWGLLFNADAFPTVDNAQWFKVWGESLKAVLTTVLVSGATWVLGRRVQKVVQLEISDSWVRFGFEFGFGIIVLGFFWVGIGLCGLWYAPVWQGFAVILVLDLVWDVFNLLRRYSLPSWNPIKSIGPSYIFLGFAGLVYVSLTLLVDLTPETFYDSMVYHLAVPEYWLSHHGLSDFPTNFFSNYPYGAETYFLNGLVFQGTESAKMLHAVALVVCALLAAGWAREVGGTRAGYLVLGLVLTLPHFTINTWTTQVEGFLALAVVLFIYALNRWVGSQTPQWTFVAGLLAGLAVGVKYNGVIVIVAALMVLIFQKSLFKDKDLSKSCLLFAVAFFLTAGPWILKNWVYTGNPTFPYFSSLFQGRHLPAAGYERLLVEQQGRITDHWWDWLILPWKLVISNPDSYSFAGPVALAFLPLLLLFKLKHPTLRFLVWVSLLVFIASVAVTHILRFMLPDFVLLYILLGAVLAGGDRPVWG